jgi:hypothetical protein
MSSKRMGQARFEGLAKSLNKRDGGIDIPVAELNPGKYHAYFDEFHTAHIATDSAVTAATAGVGMPWDATIASGGSILLDIAKVGGQVKLLNDTTDNDVLNMQAIGAGFKFASSKKLWFECKLNVADADRSGFFVGLASASGAADPSVMAEFDDCVGFTTLDGAAAVTIDHVVAKGSAQTLATTGNTLTDDTEVTLSIYWDGSTFYYYVDGVLGTGPANTNTPDNVVVFPTIEFANRHASANFMHVDYIRVVQER